ncbi:MmsB 3-hydroxyisobutyrate dehydrogenase [Pyrenophora tritici-repentis]|uniref:3-hydroxyisobutyrate dehydrogenase n=3 Tax=Pyrenophora tritici-repentis TaxID=45151 RepID=A0A2W1GRL5_9PLEO|nr:3-hydroxyisobutyrate dehydrogenase mitochondrial [Pyrenophora tritici-repentis]KAF7446300.1 3-hydroxyisobutyrate dehydrogenase mitochondrial [Pyrenophora tritici-repentis]KAF7567407.1 MmsB, 3-hydroxyisobutyrate dehydrogenase and related beta-hydroxyacid dehydrogenase [Pyrenophora tritici-repentis]KAG9381995.1 3-hydroxyisobutyrate dehydrogenase mitochondrial [Pyrenophora tritici-repentis]KAI0579106.1 3-hydroxyisobutyrate dehydrogenase mitochondrial [Pyrenophora tritici-repentis]
MSENYAFIGLGAMGYAMASNLRQKLPPTSTLYINDINASALTRFIKEYFSYGPIIPVSTAREAAAHSKVVVSIVPGAQDVKAVYLDEQNGVIAAGKDEERILLECSTIDVESTKEVGRRLRGMGVYIDAPVSGGVPAAEAGTLAMLIGYPPPATSSSGRSENHISKRLTDVLGMMGSPEKFFYLHTLGAGLTAKICNNYLSGTILLATAEAMATGVAHGLDPSDLYQVIKNSTGQSWMCDHVMPVPNVQKEYWVPSNSGYKPGFKTQMMLKDLGLGIESAKQVSVEPSMAAKALEVWERAAKDERCIDRDGSSIYLHLGGQLPEGYEDKGKKSEKGTWVFAD